MCLGAIEWGLGAIEWVVDEPLLTHHGDLVSGEIVDRPNRFVLRVRFDGARKPRGDLPADRNAKGADDAGTRIHSSQPPHALEDVIDQVHLGDPGVLPTLLASGNEILCAPVDDADRVTAYDAIAARTGDTAVGLRATLANDLFERALDGDALPEFRDYNSVTREPALPDHGRADFLLETSEGDEAYVEVKSCSLARDDVARWPDRSTERGRRHLRCLARIASDGTNCHVVFVVQRPDVVAFRPLREADPEFADLLEEAQASGVDVRAIVVAFEAPHYRLRTADLPVELGA